MTTQPPPAHEDQALSPAPSLVKDRLGGSAAILHHPAGHVKG
jgi:hypothetical protein